MTDIGVIIASEPHPHRWSGLGALAADAEALGVDAVWFADHLLWSHPTPDATTAVALAAAATTRATVGPMVLQLPMRHTASVAKSFGFLNEITEGRIVLGVGVGEHRSEYEAAGVGDRFSRRGRLLDRAITELRTHWSGAGDPPMTPVRSVPIWIGGRSAAARRRAATVGDAWIPHFTHIRWYRRQIPRFHEEVDEAGRLEAPRAAALVLIHVDEVEPENDPLGWAGTLYGLPPAAFAPILVRGSANEVATRLDEFAEAGATHLALLPSGGRPLDHVAAVIRELRT